MTYLNPTAKNDFDLSLTLSYSQTTPDSKEDGDFDNCGFCDLSGRELTDRSMTTEEIRETDVEQIDANATAEDIYDTVKDIIDSFCCTHYNHSYTTGDDGVTHISFTSDAQTTDVFKCEETSYNASFSSRNVALLDFIRDRILSGAIEYEAQDTIETMKYQPQLELSL